MASSFQNIFIKVENVDATKLSHFNEDFNKSISICEEIHTKITKLHKQKILNVEEKSTKRSTNEQDNKVDESLFSLTGNEKKPYKCKQCSKRYTKLRYFKFHYQIKHNKNYFKCISCRRYFVNMFLLDKHLIQINCHICKRQLNCESSLKRHLREQHNVYNK